MKLDLRRPVIVLAGAWNPAIFQPGWVARHGHQMPEGKDVEVTQLAGVIAGESRVVSYIGLLGTYASPSRLELYANAASPSVFHRLEELAKSLWKSLPHTPIAGYGVNFHFILDHADASLLQQLEPNDRVPDRYRVHQNMIHTAMISDDGVLLNFKRISKGDNVAFDFNYHHQDPKKIRALLSSTEDYLSLRFDESLSLLRDMYGVSACEELGHDLQNPEWHLERGET